MMKKNEKFYMIVGISAILLGLVVNKWSLSIISPDGNINSRTFLRFIFIYQIVMVISGIVIILFRKRLFKISKAELALFSGTLVFIFFIFEISSRIWLNRFAGKKQFRSYALYTDLSPTDMLLSPHHYLTYYPTPNYRSGFKYHNSLGFRNDEFPITKPTGHYRIVTLGGSTTYTEFVEDNKKTFTYLLEKFLREKYGYKDVEVINAGVPGYNSWESLINLEFRVLDLDPDLVIVYHGTNDVHTRLVAPSAYRGDNSGRRKRWTSPKILFYEHSCILRIISRRFGWTHQVGLGAFVDVFNIKDRSSKGEKLQLLEKNPPIYFQRNLANMVVIAKAHNVDVILATWAYSPYCNDYASTKTYVNGFAENNTVVREVAKKYNAYLFDFVNEMSQEKRYWFDGRHVNEEGAVLKATLFAKYIDSSGVIHQTESVKTEQN